MMLTSECDQSPDAKRLPFGNNEKDLLIMRKKTANFAHYLRMLLVSAILPIAVFPFCGPAYAARAIDLTETDTVESLIDTEQAAKSRFRGHVGGEVNYAAGIRNEEPHRARPVPLVFAEYDDWVYGRFTGGVEAGVWLWQTPDHMQKAGVSVQTHGGSPILNGMEIRKASTDGVMNFQWRTPENYMLLTYQRDIGNASNGDSATLALSHNLIFRQPLSGHDFLLVPRIDLEWQSARLVDYYYGVRPSEAAPNRPAYAGRDTINGGIKLTGFLRLDRSWAVFAGMHTGVFGPGIMDSPLVKRRSTTRGYIGAVWFF